MQQPNIGYIYKTIIPPTDNEPYEKFYIGKKESSIFKENYFGSGVRIKNYIKKYGTEQLKVFLIEWTKSRIELNKLEYDYIYPNLGLKECWNLAEGGTGGFLSEEINKKISNILKGIIPWNKGKTGIYSNETIEKMINSHKGQTPWNKDKKGVQVAWNKGIEHSDETKEKMSLSRKKHSGPNKGKKMSEEQKLKISNTLKMRNNNG